MSDSGTFGVILPAAGSGTRFGGGDKLLLELGGKTVLQRSLGLFLDRPEVVCIVVVTGADRIGPYREHLGNPSRVDFVMGGAERWESVMNGLRHLAGLASPPTFVAVHDAARPLC